MAPDGASNSKEDSQTIVKKDVTSFTSSLARRMRYQEGRNAILTPRDKGDCHENRTNCHRCHWTGWALGRSSGCSQPATLRSSDRDCSQGTGTLGLPSQPGTLTVPSLLWPSLWSLPLDGETRVSPSPGRCPPSPGRSASPHPQLSHASILSWPWTS